MEGRSISVDKDHFDGFLWDIRVRSHNSESLQFTISSSVFLDIHLWVSARSVQVTRTQTRLSTPAALDIHNSNDIHAWGSMHPCLALLFHRTPFLRTVTCDCVRVILSLQLVISCRGLQYLGKSSEKK